MTPYEKAQMTYETAKEALNDIAQSLAVSDKQKKEARTARDKLIDDYIDDQIIKITELTAKYADFIQEMETVIANIEKDSPLEALNTLQKIVDQGALVLKGIS
ncbi:MAG: hypothetical protein KKE44_23715 [Proteobacteria bacterium]|nr:hypothetical protein [Pseudomonadota bacterium]MBU1585741.1 hypothetical protein [Pseudomonadota bacterium]MBU2453585.1 hypothetical protein [Pseudomonadota bacterium]